MPNTHHYRIPLVQCEIDGCTVEFSPAMHGGHEKRYCSRAHKELAKARRRAAIIRAVQQQTREDSNEETNT